VHGDRGQKPQRSARRISWSRDLNPTRKRWRVHAYFVMRRTAVVAGSAILRSCLSIYVASVGTCSLSPILTLNGPALPLCIFMQSSFARRWFLPADSPRSDYLKEYLMLCGDATQVMDTGSGRSSHAPCCKYEDRNTDAGTQDFCGRGQGTSHAGAILDDTISSVVRSGCCNFRWVLMREHTHRLVRR
jgi:hypothetical protein